MKFEALGARKRRVVSTGSTLALLSLVLASCDDVTRPPAARRDAPSPMQQVTSTRRIETLDEEFARIGGQVPGGFAGLYADSPNSIVVLLTDLAQSAVAKVRLDEALRRHTQGRYGSTDGPAVIFRKADYPFSDLKRWHDHIDASWNSIPGMVMSDIDEFTNRIEVGVKDTSASRQALNLVRVSGAIPAAAVMLVQSQEVQITQDLNGGFSSLPGGPHAAAQGRGTCTLGINVLYNSMSSFIVAGHCGLTQGAVDASPWVHAAS